MKHWHLMCGHLAASVVAGLWAEARHHHRKNRSSSDPYFARSLIEPLLSFCSDVPGNAG